MYFLYILADNLRTWFIIRQGNGPKYCLYEGLVGCYWRAYNLKNRIAVPLNEFRGVTNDAEIFYRGNGQDTSRLCSSPSSSISSLKSARLHSSVSPFHSSRWYITCYFIQVLQYTQQCLPLHPTKASPLYRPRNSNESSPPFIPLTWHSPLSVLVVP